MSTKRRKLPKWMEDDESDDDAPKKVVSRKTHQHRLKGANERTLPLLESNFDIVYLHRRETINSYCVNLLDRLSREKVVAGFDAEWNVKFNGQQTPLALLQIFDGSSSVILLHLSAVGQLTEKLRQVIEHFNFYMVGVNVSGDIWKIARDYNLPEAHRCVRDRCIDLSTLANEKLKSSERWSLRNLVRHLFQKDISKSDDVRLSGWEEVPLRHVQQRYAALDAYASFIIYHKLMGEDFHEKLGNELESKKANFLQLNTDIIYLREMDEIEFYCKHLLSRLKDEKVTIGFDAKWNDVKVGEGGTPLALLQMYDGKGFVTLLHLFALHELPEITRQVIQHPNLVMVGLQIAKKLWKLSRDYDLPQIIHCVQKDRCKELSTLANTKIDSDRRWSLSALVEVFLKKQIERTTDIRNSIGWEVIPLSESQQKSAALDVFACYWIYDSLTNKI